MLAQCCLVTKSCEVLQAARSQPASCGVALHESQQSNGPRHRRKTAGVAARAEEVTSSELEFSRWGW